MANEARPYKASGCYEAKSREGSYVATQLDQEAEFCGRHKDEDDEQLYHRDDQSKGQRGNAVLSR